ncbi:MAG: tetratricopeptide repeat protein [Chloroflexota bacterium]
MTTLLEFLNELEGHDLIAVNKGEGDADYSFKHVFTQESVYDSLLRSDRRQMHQQVGEALEEIFSDRLNDEALLLAHHFEQSGDLPRALRYLQIAADHAFKAFANQEAQELYSRILSLLDRDAYEARWNALAEREQVLDRLGERSQQANDLTQLQTLAELMEDDTRLTITHNRRAAYFDKISEYAAAAEAATVGVRTARRANNAHLEAQGLNLLALSAWRRFEYREVQRWAQDALDALRIVGDPGTRITCLLHLGRASYRLGQYDAALSYIQAAQDLSQETDNRASNATADLIFGWIYQRLGDYDSAEKHFQQMLNKREHIGDRYGEATALSHLGWLAWDQEKPHKGLDYCQQALEISGKINDRENEAYALSGLALNYERLDDVDRAIAYYKAALEQHEQIGATTLAIFDQAGLARLATHQNNLDLARDYIGPVRDWILQGRAQQFWDPWIIYQSTYQVLTTLEETETAYQILAEAHTILHQRAEEISDEALRLCFTEEVQVNREIEAAWQEVNGACLTSPTH